MRVLAGSLNLLAPVDLTPEGDSLALENWRVDSVGALRSRKGSTLQAALGGTIHTLWMAGADRYAGVGTELRRGTAFENTLFSDLDGSPIGLAAYLGFVWVMNQNRRAKVAGGVSQWGNPAPLTAPTVTPGFEGPLTGDYTYHVTFDDYLGHESNPGPASATVKLTNQVAELSNIPLPPPGITARHIYRTGGGLTSALRVGTVWDADTTFVDMKSDAELQAANIELEFDHDPPPAAMGLVGPYYGKLIAFRSAAHPNRMWWTPTARPWYFPGSDDDFEGNWMDVGDDNEAIVAITFHKRLLVIYKERSIWRLQGDPDSNDPELANSNVAIFGGMRAVVSAGAHDYYLGADGVYRFNGDFEERVSRKLDPIFQGNYTEIGHTTAGARVNVPPMDHSWNQHSALGFEPGRLYLSYPRDGSSTWTECVAYEVDSGNWANYSLGSGAGFSAFGKQGGNFPLLMAAGGNVFENNQRETDAGAAIPLTWQSAFLDQGLPDNPKMYADLVIDYRTAEANQTTSTLAASVMYDYGVAVALGNLSSNVRTKARFPLGTGGKGRQATNISVRIAGSASSTVTIFGVYIHYYVLPRQGLTFDSGVFDLGTDQAKLMDRFELEFECAGAVNWTFYSDLPGGVLTQRDTGTISATAGQRNITVPIGAAGYYGRRGRLVLTSTQTLVVHGLRIRTLPIGVYLDGSLSEFWQTQPITLTGSPDSLNLYREIELLAESTGAATLEVWTELPGRALTKRKEFSLAETAGRRPFNFRLPGDCQGQTIQFKLTPADGVTTMLLKGAIFAKPLGVESAWAWYPIQMLGTPPEWAWVDLPVDAAE